MRFTREDRRRARRRLGMDQTLSTVFSRKWGVEEAGLELGERMRMMSSERLANLNMAATRGR